MRRGIVVAVVVFTGSALAAGIAGADGAQLSVTPLSGHPGDVITLDFDCTADPPTRQLWTNVLDGVPLHPHSLKGTFKATVRADATPAGNGNYWIALDCAHSYAIPAFTVLQ